MNKNRYITVIPRLLCLALLPLLTTGCLYEHPELTADGELGIDPTSVMLDAEMTLTFKMPAFEEGGASLERPEAGEAPAYRHRFIIEAYLDRAFAARQVIYAEITDGKKELTLPISMKLHARNYEIAVWSDYVQRPDTEKEITGTEDYFYNTTTGHLLNVYGSSTYRGNNDYKDAFCATAELNLEEFRDQWNAQVSLDLTLQRPLARIQFAANDVDDFLQQINDGTVNGTDFVTRLRYNDYLDMGYNVLKRLPRHGLMYLSCERTFKKDDLVRGQPLPLIFDYVFAVEGENTSIPVTLEVLDSEASTVLASTSFNVFCKAGHHTTVTYGFLTANTDGGVTIDPDFNGKDEIDVPGHTEE